MRSFGLTLGVDVGGMSSDVALMMTERGRFPLASGSVLLHGAGA
jgi:hypothetical protein